MQTRSPGQTAPINPIAQALDLGNTLIQIESIRAERLAALPVAAIDELIGLLAGIAGRVQSAQAEITKALTTRYAERAKSLLLAEGRDTGTTHIVDGDFDVSVEIDKSVKWNQKHLAEIFARITASGEKATDYIDLKYSVSETCFKSWPETLRKPFEAARTVTPGKPKFTLKHIGEGR